MRYEEGYWWITADDATGQAHYKQRFDPTSPAPKRGIGWEVAPYGRAPVPSVQPSWERELLFRGVLHRQQAAPGEEGPTVTGPTV